MNGTRIVRHLRPPWRPARPGGRDRCPSCPTPRRLSVKPPSTLQPTGPLQRNSVPLELRVSRIRFRPTTTSASQLLGSQAPAAQESMRRNESLLPPGIVGSKEMKLALPLIGNAAYVALASGFLMTDMLTLRLALVGGYTGLVAFHSLHPRPLRIPLRWSALFVLVNAGAAVLLVADRWPGSLTEEERRLYDEHFSMLTPGQFQQLVSLGRTRQFPTGARLTTEGVRSDAVLFVRSGRCRLYLRERYAKDIDAGSFVNDVAFQRGDVGAYGTVVADGEEGVEAIEWDRGRLREYLDARPEMDRNVRLCLTEGLVRGLLQQRRAAYAREEDGEGGGTLGPEELPAAEGE